MRLLEIERKARSQGIKDTWKYTRRDLIRQIQTKEGNIPCFASGKRICDQSSCLWRSDCIR
jgi:hypothetical protein